MKKYLFSRLSDSVYASYCKDPEYRSELTKYFIQAFMKLLASIKYILIFAALSRSVNSYLGDENAKLISIIRPLGIAALLQLITFSNINSFWIYHFILHAL